MNEPATIASSEAGILTGYQYLDVVAPIPRHSNQTRIFLYSVQTGKMSKLIEVGLETWTRLSSLNRVKLYETGHWEIRPENDIIQELETIFEGGDKTNAS